MLGAMSRPSPLELHQYLQSLVYWEIMTWNACTLVAGLGSVHNALQLYVLYNYWRMIFEDTNSHKQGCALQLQQCCYAFGDCIVVLWDARDALVVPEAVECSYTEDESLQYLASSKLSELYTLMEFRRSTISNDKKFGDWAEVPKCSLRRGRFPAMILAWKCFYCDKNVGSKSSTEADYSDGPV